MTKRGTITPLPLYAGLMTIACLVLGYQPVVNLGNLSGIHLDISLLYVLIVLTVAVNLPVIWKNRVLLISPPFVFLLAIVVYGFASIIWTPNTGRGIMTALFLTLIALLAVVFALQKNALLRYPTALRNIFIGAILIASIMALYQIFGDAFGIDNSLLLLPDMYTGSVFGIARPTAFSLEPQFLGSLLLIPFGWLSFALAKRINKTNASLLIIIGTLLLLTLSRGALIGAVTIIIATCISSIRSLRLLGAYLVLGLMSIIFALGITFTAAEIRKDAISGEDAVSNVIEHISLGTIHITQEDTHTLLLKTAEAAPALATTVPPGYVSESTTSRLTMSEQALELWTQNRHTVLFGVGIGGFGASLRPAQPGVIANNYYLEMLAEQGLVGITLFIGFIGSLFYTLIRKKQWLLITIISALLVQMYFFSGNANIVHVWVLLGIALSFALTKKPHVNR